MLIPLLLVQLAFASVEMPTKYIFNTQAPIIGILTQPLDDASQYNFIAQSYVGWLEMAGARVVPVHWDANLTVWTDLLSQINGLLIQGGSVTIWNQTENRLSNYAAAVCRIFDLVLQLNDKGDYFPLWGTCHGFETIQHCVTRTPWDLMGNFKDKHENHMLQFTEETANSTLFGDVNSTVYWNFQNMRLMHFNHIHGIYVTRFKQDDRLTRFFNLLSVNRDDYGEFFISSIEGKNYPIVGTQFHPEKGPFEWYPTRNFPDFYEAMQASWHLSNYFVNMTRMSTHSPRNALNMYQSLIFRYQAIDGIYGFQSQTNAVEIGYEQVYLFYVGNQSSVLQSSKPSRLKTQQVWLKST